MGNSVYFQKIRLSAFRVFTVVLPALIGVLPEVSAAEVRGIDSAMYFDPHFVLVAPTRVFSPKLKPLWLQALARPEADLQRQAAEAIAKARRLGMSGLEDTIPPLMETLATPGQHPVVKLAVVRALITLDAREAAPLFQELITTNGAELANLAEPALARWDYQPMRQLWQQRLVAPNASRGRILLAIQGLGMVREIDAVPLLEKLVVTRSTPVDLRWEAARSWSQIQTEGLENRARELAADKSPQRLVDRLAAATLLSNHSGESAVVLLKELAVDLEPAVAAIAVTRLLSLDPQQVLAFVDHLVAHTDTKLRRLAVESLATAPVITSVSRLGAMLDDPHPDVRRLARDALLQFAEDAALRADVINEAAKMLASNDWRGLEQVLILVGRLDHEPAANRLFELFDHKRSEVSITASWALRRLAIPETLETMLALAEREAAASPTVILDFRLSHLFQAFGLMKYEPALPLLRRFVAKVNDAELIGLTAEARGAAIWSLGHFYDGSPDTALATELVARLEDYVGLLPEMTFVRRMSAVTLGRMRAENSLPTLRRFLEIHTSNDEVGYSCAWAIQQVTGEAIPKQESIQSAENWFLTPIEGSSSAQDQAEE